MCLTLEMINEVGSERYERRGCTLSVETAVETHGFAVEITHAVGSWKYISWFQDLALGIMWL